MEDDQQFCLRWNNHQTTLIQNFDTLLESGTLVDCTLAAEGKYLKAHKVVLSACSPYFEGLLSEHYDKHPVFILKDVKFKELKAMMDYMYRGEVNISQDQLAALLKAAESLQIKGLSESKTGSGSTSSSKAESRSQKTASQPTAPSLDIPHSSSGLTIEKNSKVPRQSLAQTSVGDLPEDSASPSLSKGISSREGSVSPNGRKRKRYRRRSLNDDNPIDNHETSNSSDMSHQPMNVPALGVAPVADEKSMSDPSDSLGRSALMQQLTKPADDMLPMPVEKPEPNDTLIEPKSEYLDEAEDSVEDLTLDDDGMDDGMDDSNRAGPSHDSSHPGLASWHVTGDRSNAGGVVGSVVAGAPGSNDEVFMQAQEAAQAHRDSQEKNWSSSNWTLPTLPSTSGKDMTSTRRLRSTTFGDDGFYATKGRVRRLGPRKYLCRDCGDTFALKASLTRHQSLECRDMMLAKKAIKVKTMGGGHGVRGRPRNIHPKMSTTMKPKMSTTMPLKTIKTLPAKSTTVVNLASLKGMPIEELQQYLKPDPDGPDAGNQGLWVHGTLPGDVPQKKKKKHTCKRCGRIYAFYTSLWRHLHYECGMEPKFPCEACPLRFAQKSNLERHIKNMHTPHHNLTI